MLEKLIFAGGSDVDASQEEIDERFQEIAT